MEKIMKKLPDTIKYKRGNVWLIILGYLFAIIAGVNGIESIHDLIYQWMGLLYLGLVNRIVVAAGILFIYLIIRWSFTYMRAKAYTPDDEGGMYEHLKYDAFTRTNGLIIFTVFLVTALLRGLSLQW